MSRRLYLFILICWLTSVFTLLWIPLPYFLFWSNKIAYADKAVHFIFFGVMEFLFLALGLKLNKFKYLWVALFSFTVVTLLNMIGEAVQDFIPGRIPSYADFFAGLLGILAAIPLAYMIYRSPRPKLLLHVCCAPCATAVEEILSAGYQLELYFFNPNIHPYAEYLKRLAEVKKLAQKLSLKLIIGNYDHHYWLRRVSGLEAEVEGGKRCDVCFIHRLNNTAALARRRNISSFATTLSISPHKNSHQINSAGGISAGCAGLDFLARDFKADNGWQRSLLLSKKFGFYRQKYCGCEFSSRSANRLTQNG
ncbi:MAG TPA: epoxyqueuosine reductase QueH [Candidatus Methylomirabilis sp.]|nr:epoxyqueuosine reductase QueH [Candidatus Methylomirabilis sp.]